MKPGKQELRKQFLELRLKWDETYLRKISDKIGDALYQYIKSTFTPKIGAIALFWPIENKCELDLKPLVKELSSEGYKVALPVINPENNTMFFREFTSEQSLIKQKFGMYEPNQSCHEIAASEMSLVVAPALAVDRKGFRLGYGGGYYDRFIADLKRVKPKAVAAAVVADEFLVSKLIKDGLDRPMEVIFTEKEAIQLSTL